MKSKFNIKKFNLRVTIYLILFLLMFTATIRLSSQLLAPCTNPVESIAIVTDGKGFDKFLAENPPIRDEEKIIRYLHEFHLTPPSRKPYNLNPKMRKYPTQLQQLKHLFKNKRNGFFIEAGANDGEFLSNTLDLEMNKNWTGLLIEPNPFMVPALRMTNRKAWITDVCLATNGYPEKVRFLHDTRTDIYKQGGGNIENSGFNQARGGLREPEAYIFAGSAECFPLETLLSAIDQSEVDYFSLDVEGVEFKILNKFPFDKIKVKVLSIEHNLIPEGYNALKQLLTVNNYNVVFFDPGEVIVVHKDHAHEFMVSESE